MPWWQFALLGAVGGAIVEALAVFRYFAAWQDARRSRDCTIKRVPPKQRRYVDIPAHTIMLPARMALGTAEAVLFGVTGQVTGPYGAVAIDCAAPVLLAQPGSVPKVVRAASGASETRKQAEAKYPAYGAEIPAEATVPSGESCSS
jgi:hypothetical protein